MMNPHKYHCNPAGFILLSVLFVSCQEITPDPKSERAEKLQTILDQTLERYNGIGVSATIVFEAQDIWSGTSGISHGSTALTHDMVLCTGSVTKTYLAALSLALADEGWFSLDDSLQNWLPEYESVEGSITIKQLLYHTSGVYNVTDNPALWEAVFKDPSRLWTPGEVFSAFMDEPYADPGMGWYYSNTNYMLLGMIIEEATGSKVSELIRDRFLLPLGLNQTFFAVEEDLPANAAHGWFNLSGNGVEDVSLIPLNGFYSVLWTSAAIFATSENLARWCSDLFMGRILSEASLHQMLDPCCPMPGTSDVACAMGLFLIGPGNSTGVEMMGYTGRTFGYLASMFYLPGNSMSIAVMINEDNTPLLYEITTALILEVLE